MTAVYAVAKEFTERGFGGQLLAAAFRFDGGEQPVYWIYGFKTGTFWPFVPTGEKQERDNARELQLKAQLEKELPVEQDLTKWFALFDAPMLRDRLAHLAGDLREPRNAGIRSRVRHAPTPKAGRLRGRTARPRPPLCDGLPISRAISASAASRFSIGG